MMAKRKNESVLDTTNYIRDFSIPMDSHEEMVRINAFIHKVKLLSDFMVANKIDHGEIKRAIMILDQLTGPTIDTDKKNNISG